MSFLFLCLTSDVLSFFTSFVPMGRETHDDRSEANGVGATANAGATRWIWEGGEFSLYLAHLIVV